MIWYINSDIHVYIYVAPVTVGIIVTLSVDPVAAYRVLYSTHILLYFYLLYQFIPYATFILVHFVSIKQIHIWMEEKQQIWYKWQYSYLSCAGSCASIITAPKFNHFNSKVNQMDWSMLPLSFSGFATSTLIGWAGGLIKRVVFYVITQVKRIFTNNAEITVNHG